MTVTVEFFTVTNVVKSKWSGKENPVESKRVKLEHTCGDSYVIDQTTYNRLSKEGKSDLQIFEYVEDIMRH